MAEKQGVPSDLDPNYLSEVGIEQTDEFAGLKKAGDVAQGIFSNMSPLEKTALATSPLPIVGDIAGVAADIDMYANRPEERTGLNYLLSALGVLPFIPSRSQVKAAAEGIEQLAKETPSGRIATSKQPFVTRGTQWLQEKVRGNMPKEQLMDSVEKAGLPETDTLMLKQAIDQAELDNKGRVNMFSLMDEYKNISPESRTSINVLEPEGGRFNSTDNLTGEDLGVIQLNVRARPAPNPLDTDEGAINLISRLGSDYGAAGEFIAVSKLDPERFNEIMPTVYRAHPELQDLIGQDIEELTSIGALYNEAQDRKRLFNGVQSVFRDLARKNKGEIDTPLANYNFNMSTPEVREIMLERGELLDLQQMGIDTPEKLEKLLESLGKDRREVTIYRDGDMDTILPSMFRDTGGQMPRYLRPDPPDPGPGLSKWNSSKTDVDDATITQAAERILFKNSDPSVSEWFSSPDFKEVELTNPSARASQMRMVAVNSEQEAGKIVDQYATEVNSVSKRISKKLKNTGRKSGVYKSGQHSSLESKEPDINPMSFARFADVDAVVDGKNISGMHVSELQSDYADDLRSYGPTTSSTALDDLEVIKMQSRIETIENQLEDGFDAALDTELQSLKLKKERLSKRSSSAKRNPDNYYQIEELYPNMTERGNAQQTIDIMGAVSAAVQRGRNAISFPIPDDIGSSDAKPLYEPSKFNNNLREAAKRLGKDFRTTLIEITDKNGDVVQRPGIVWSGDVEPTLGKANIGGVKMFRAGGIISAKPPVRGNSGIVDVIKKYRREGMMD